MDGTGLERKAKGSEIDKMFPHRMEAIDQSFGLV